MVFMLLIVYEGVLISIQEVSRLKETYSYTIVHRFVNTNFLIICLNLVDKYVTKYLACDCSIHFLYETKLIVEIIILYEAYY